MGVDQQESNPAGQPGQQPSMHAVVTSVSSNKVYSFTKPVRDEIVLIEGLGVAGDVHAGVTVRHRGRVAADPGQPNLRQVHLIGSELHDELREAGYEVPAGGLGENITTTGVDLLALPVGTVLRFSPVPHWEPALPALHARSAMPGPSDGAAAVGPGPFGGAAAVVACARHANLNASTAGAVAALAARVAAESAAMQSAAHGPAAERQADPDPRPAVVVTGLRNPCQQINHFRPGLLKRVLVRHPDGSVERRAGVMAVVLRGGAVRPGMEIRVEFPASPHLPLDRV